MTPLFYCPPLPHLCSCSATAPKLCFSTAAGDPRDLAGCQRGNPRVTCLQVLGRRWCGRCQAGEVAGEGIVVHLPPPARDLNASTTCQRALTRRNSFRHPHTSHPHLHKRQEPRFRSTGGFLIAALRGWWFVLLLLNYQAAHLWSMVIRICGDQSSPEHPTL